MEKTIAQIQNRVEEGGFHFVKNLKATDERARFFVYQYQRETARYVLKIAGANFGRELENEIWWNMTMTRLVEAAPEVKIQVPKIFEYGQNWYISDFFAAPMLVEEIVSHDVMVRHIERLAKMLIDLDGIALQPQLSAKPLYESSNSAPYTNLWHKVDGWMKQPLAHGIISQAEITAAKQLVEKYRPYIRPSLQHGDFVPWHMFELGDDVIGLIDGEHASLIKPRYYDLAYLYTRLFTRLENSALPVALLKAFLAYVDPAKQDDFVQAWLPVVTLRTLGMYNDAIADIANQDYTAQAQDLLRRCLSENINTFLKE